MLAWVVIYRRQHRQAHKPKPIRLFRSGPIHSFPSFLTSLHHYLLTSSFPYPLPSSVCCNSFVCRSYENYRGVYQQFPFWNESTRSNVEESLITRHHISSSFFSNPCALFCTPLHFFALSQNSTRFLSSASALFAKKHTLWAGSHSASAQVSCEKCGASAHTISRYNWERGRKAAD
jgi:hypothetical protein